MSFWAILFSQPPTFASNPQKSDVLMAFTVDYTPLYCVYFRVMQGYQGYLVNLEVVKQQANVAIEQAKYNADVGKAQALNLNRADIKIITNTSDGNIGGGVSKVMDLFSPQGGTALSGMLEAFAQTDAGKSVLDKIGLNKQAEKKN